LAVLTVLAGHGVVGPAGSGASESTTEVLYETSFESVFPRLPWSVSHPPGAADVDWGRSRYRASDGDSSIYCAGLGPAAPGDGGPAPAHTASWAVLGPFDLSETTSGRLIFDLWMKTEAYQDVFFWLVSVDGESFLGSARSTSTTGWKTVTADLGSWGTAGSVIGRPEVWFAFVYQSDRNRLFEGAYVDRVRLEVDTGTPGDLETTYTTDDDFAQGEAVGLESTSDRLELTDEWDALPYLWVPSSVTGAVSKVDVDSGDELARYRTGPDAAAEPGVAAVDLDGACWVGNRGLGSVVKIADPGLGGCVDRDGDGGIDTSTDRDDDGDITGSELLDWGDDECVLFEVVLVEGSEAVHTPGDDHDDYAANNLQAVAVDPDGDVWAGVADSNLAYRLDGATGEILEQLDLADDAVFPAAAAVDDDGTLWLSSWPDPWVLGYDPASGETLRIDLDHGSYGLALDDSDGLYVTGLDQSLVSRVDRSTNTAEWSEPAYFLPSGIATDEDGRIWVASSGEDTISRYNRQGGLTRFITVPGAPTGVAVDQGGRIWVVGALNDTIYRLDPDTLQSDLDKLLVDFGGSDAIGDLTGIVARNLTARYGTWTVNHDSQAPGTPWGLLSWQGTAPAGSSISVRVRSSEDEAAWSDWEIAVSGTELASTPAGRYLQIEVALHRSSGDELPVLDELTVAPSSTQTAPVASFSYSPGVPAAGQTVAFTDTSSGGPTSWSWDFGDGSTSSEQNPSHAFADPGEYDVALTAGNDAGSDTATATVTVGAGSGCSITCSAAAPQTGRLNESVSFSAEAEPVGCTEPVAFEWSFGDGRTGTEQNPSHSYSTTGTLRWRMTAGSGDASCARSGDITISGQAPSECTFTAWVPVVSRADGANGSVWRSDLTLLGSDPEGADVEIRWHATGGVVSGVLTVVPDASVLITDVVGWLDPSASGSAALEICADGEVVVDTRTYNVLAADHACLPGGTFGQYLQGTPAGGGLAAGDAARLGQLRESDDFRTNIGLVNTGGDPATVAIDLLDATGVVLTSYELEIGAGRWQQDNRPFANRAGRDDLTAASARIEVVSGSGVIAYASVIDGTTNDAFTVPMAVAGR
jgi:PKD repeat protein/streptogramin lyase